MWPHSRVWLRESEAFARDSRRKPLEKLVSDLEAIVRTPAFALNESLRQLLRVLHRNKVPSGRRIVIWHRAAQSSEARP